MAALQEQIPKRDQLLQKLQRANGLVLPIVGVQVVAILVVAFLIDWGQVANSPFLYLLAIGVVVGPFVGQILRIIAQNKKEIGSLKESTRFGQFDKHNLRNLFQETQKKLGLPQEHVSVFVTADRTLNAMAGNIGLGPISRLINGIYLHRQLLHKFSPAEVQDTIGHELGHYYAYYLKRTRYHWLSCLLGAMLAMGVAQWLGLGSLLGYLALFAASSAAFYFSTRVPADLLQTIEYLCDDFGSHVNGVEVGINCLMKMGANQEVETAVFFESLDSKHFLNLSAAEIAETINKAIPYGHASKEELDQAVQTELKKRATVGPSLTGFLKYAWQADSDEAADELMERLAVGYRKMRDTPRLNWEDLLFVPNQIEFTQESLPFLIQMIEDNPSMPLFHELTPPNAESTHPPMKNRILYLWYNRQAIQSSRAL